MSIDSIADFLTIIRNGVMVSKSSVSMPYSRMRHAIAQILKDEGFIRDIAVVNADSTVQKSLKLFLKYVSGEAVIHEITRVSKPGRRMYFGSNEIRPVVGKLGISIISTNRGVIANRKARALNVGGEILCTVW